MFKYSLVHRGGRMRYILRFIHNYQLKWLPADILFILDCLGHGIGASEYHQLFGLLGFQTTTVDAAISALGLVRIIVLVYQRTIESET